MSSYLLKNGSGGGGGKTIKFALYSQDSDGLATNSTSVIGEGVITVRNTGLSDRPQYRRIIVKRVSTGEQIDVIDAFTEKAITLNGGIAMYASDINFTVYGEFDI